MKLEFSMIKKTANFLPFAIIFATLSFKKFQDGSLNIYSAYFIGILAGAALSLSTYGVIIHFRNNKSIEIK